MRGILLGADDMVAAWAWRTIGLTPMPCDLAIGIVSEDKGLEGAAVFQNFNGNNIELSYYGEGTLSLGIARALARAAISRFSPSRVTVCTSKSNRSLVKALTRPMLGFKLEGAQRCYYGPRDTTRNTALRFVMFRDQLERIARNPVQENRTA